MNAMAQAAINVALKVLDGCQSDAWKPTRPDFDRSGRRVSDARSTNTTHIDEVSPLNWFTIVAVSFFTPILGAPATPHRLINQRNGVIVVERIITAFDSASRRHGLLGLDEMPADQALIIAPSNAVHTWSMRFAIDLAFITRAGRIVKVRTSVPPRRIAVSIAAYAVIELASGVLAARDTAAGDTLFLVAHGSAAGPGPTASPA
jgi:uncharacterized protein